MRKTEQAEQFFRAAHSASMSLSTEKGVPDSLVAYCQFMAQGMELLAASIRDVYDRLREHSQ